MRITLFIIFDYLLTYTSLWKRGIRPCSFWNIGRRKNVVTFRNRPYYNIIRICFLI